MYILSGPSVTFMQKIYTKESSAFFKQLATIQPSFLTKIADYVAKIVDETDVVWLENVKKNFAEIYEFQQIYIS